MNVFQIINKKLASDEIQGFNVKEMKYERTHTEIMAVDEDSKNTKLVEFYTLKETKEKPKYFKYIYCEWHDFGHIMKSNIILKEEELTKTIDRYD